MDSKRTIVGVVAGLLAVGLLAAPAQAYEHGRGRHHRPYYVKDHYPSSGQVVVRFPNSVISVVIGGRKYDYCDGVFYRKHGPRYVVVAPPREIIVADTRDHGRDADDVQGVFTVHIPNSGGGYTTVIVKRSGDGFVGPQGEFYPEFPKVEQLKVMYAKAK